MALPRTGQELERESLSSSPRIQLSLFRRESQREEQERNLMKAKTFKMTLGSLLLKLDGTTDLSEIQGLAKLLKENTESKYQDSGSDSDSELEQYNKQRLFEMLVAKIDVAMKPLVERYLKGEENSNDENSMSFDDAITQLKPTYLAIYLYTLIKIVLSSYEKELTENEVKKLSLFLLIIESSSGKTDADTNSKITDYLLDLSCKNPEIKKIVMEGLSDFYMPIYNALLNYCNSIENTEKQTNSPNSILKI